MNYNLELVEKMKANCFTFVRVSIILRSKYRISEQ